MAASAYAFVVSLTNTMDQIQFHQFLSTCFDKQPQFEALREKTVFLVDFVENHSHDIALEGVLHRIAAVAQKAEDIIEVEAADRIRDGSTEISSFFLLDLQQKIEEMDLIIKVKEGMRPSEDEHPPPPSPATTAKTTMVGFDGYLIKLLDELNGCHSSRRILPIVGMGGVGKTTLARNVYGNQLIVESFSVRVWVTVSQTFNVSDIFQQALFCVGESSSSAPTTDDGGLGEKLRKALYGRRYLVVLDDMWSVEAWEEIKFYFPNNNNRSRIVVTTRERRLVDYFASSSSSAVVAVDLLDDKNSWKLFCDKAFAVKEGCPRELEAIGRKIVKKCKGLPLALDLIGGLLNRSPRTQQYWKKIEQDKSLLLEYSGGESDNTPLSILYLSYKHLPVCLKPCFLYMGLFPEDHRIDVSELILLWIAEGFIKPKPNQTPEESAGSYVKELVDRNLLLVIALRLNKKFKTCSLHDLVRDLCIKIAERENFYFLQRDMAGKHHITARSHTTSKAPSLFAPVLLKPPQVASPPSECRRLLRVLVSPLRRTSEEVNLRLLSDYNRNLDYMSKIFSPPKLPSSLSLFWGLQTILFHKTVHDVLLSDIWTMPQLRHVEISPLRLPDPPTGGGDDAIVLRKLQKLKRVWNMNLSEEVCKRIPEIKELEIRYVSQGEQDWDINVGCLNKLESLRCSFRMAVALKNLTLPESLQELSLCCCLLPWSYLAVIAMLPRLRILHLHERAMVGAEWSLCEEEQFLSLKYLRIEKCDDLIRWDADASNFPVLETLSLAKLSKLEEIPWGIGDIPTLKRMYVHGCSETANMSAIKILEEQESLENLDLKLQLRCLDWWEAERSRQKLRELGIACRNLHISYPH